MGKVFSMVARKSNRFNAENRAARIISKEKPVAAPKYPSNVEDMGRVLSLYPNLVDELNKKDSKLDDRLKQVFVKRTDQVDTTKTNPNESKSLPLERSTPEDFEYGFKETEEDEIPPGKIALRHALKFLADHQSDPENNTVSVLATKYKIDEAHMANILKYYKTFMLYIPDKNKNKLLVEPGLFGKFISKGKEN